MRILFANLSKAGNFFYSFVSSLVQRAHSQRRNERWNGQIWAWNIALRCDWDRTHHWIITASISFILEVALPSDLLRWFDDIAILFKIHLGLFDFLRFFALVTCIGCVDRTIVSACVQIISSLRLTHISRRFRIFWITGGPTAAALFWFFFYNKRILHKLMVKGVPFLFLMDGICVMMQRRFLSLLRAYGANIDWVSGFSLFTFFEFWVYVKAKLEFLAGWSEFSKIILKIELKSVFWRLIVF